MTGVELCSSADLTVLAVGERRRREQSAPSHRQMWPLLILPRPTLADHCFLVRVTNDINISDIFCGNDFCLQLSESTCEPLLQQDTLRSSVPSFLDNGSDPLLNHFLSQYPVDNWPFFTEDFLKIINRHWLAFPPPERNAHLIFMGVYLLLAFLGFPGNAIVIFMLARYD